MGISARQHAPLSHAKVLAKDVTVHVERSAALDAMEVVKDIVPVAARGAAEVVVDATDARDRAVVLATDVQAVRDAVVLALVNAVLIAQADVRHAVLAVGADVQDAGGVTTIVALHARLGVVAIVKMTVVLVALVLAGQDVVLAVIQDVRSLVRHVLRHVLEIARVDAMEVALTQPHP